MIDIIINIKFMFCNILNPAPVFVTYVKESSLNSTSPLSPEAHAFVNLSKNISAKNIIIV